MNNSRFNKAIEELRAIQMNPQEKNALHERLLAQIKTTQPSYSFVQWMGNHRFASMAVAALAIVIFGGGGLAYAAEGALPGDSLYPVKIAFLEPIHGALFVSADARARWEASLVATRLAEEDTLAQRGDLDESKQKEVETLVAVHTAAFNDALAKSDSPTSLADAKLTVERGNGEMAARSVATVHVTAAMATISATATTAAIAPTPALLKKAAGIKAADGVIHATSAVSASPATTSGTGLSLPHLPDTQTVKNAIKETTAVVNAVGSVETAAAATSTSTSAGASATSSFHGKLPL